MCVLNTGSFATIRSDFRLKNVAKTAFLSHLPLPQHLYPLSYPGYPPVPFPRQTKAISSAPTPFHSLFMHPERQAQFNWRSDCQKQGGSEGVWDWGVDRTGVQALLITWRVDQLPNDLNKAFSSHDIYAFNFSHSFCDSFIELFLSF